MMTTRVVERRREVPSKIPCFFGVRSGYRQYGRANDSLHRVPEAILYHQRLYNPLNDLA